MFRIMNDQHNPQIEGILPKGPYPPCLRMADRALLAGYPRIGNSFSRTWWKVRFSCRSQSRHVDHGMHILQASCPSGRSGEFLSWNSSTEPFSRIWDLMGSHLVYPPQLLARCQCCTQVCWTSVGFKSMDLCSIEEVVICGILATPCVTYSPEPSRFVAGVSGGRRWEPMALFAWSRAPQTQAFMRPLAGIRSPRMGMWSNP